MSGFVIRPYRSGDLEQVRKLFMSGMAEYSGPDAPAELQQSYATYVDWAVGDDLSHMEQTYELDKTGTTPRGCFWVAVLASDSARDASAPAPAPARADAASEEIVGMVGLQRLEDGSGNGELRRMSVSRAGRGTGVAGKLLATLEAFAAAQGFRKVVLTTLTTMVPACRFYTKNGYELVKTTPLDAKYGCPEHISKVAFFEKDMGGGQAESK